MLVLLVMRPVPISNDLHKFIAGTFYLTELMGISVCPYVKGTRVNTIILIQGENKQKQ